MGTHLRIAICDDNDEDRKELAKIISSTAPTFSEPPVLFSSGTALLASPHTFDIIFLDVVMESPNGIETARALRAHGDSSVIVFFSFALEHAPEGYEVEAFRYLLKPCTVEQVRSVLSDAEKHLQSQVLAIQVADTLYRLPFKDIHYAEAQGRSTILHGSFGTIVVPKGISAIEALLPAASFFRCQKSFIVGLAHIASLKRYECFMKDGTRTSVSRKLWQSFKNRVIDYLSL